MAVSTRKVNLQEQADNGVQRTPFPWRPFLLILMIAALSTLLSQLVTTTRILIDDLRYGRPRTYQLTDYIGRVEETAGATHLIALNLNRQVVVLEIPGGDTARVRTIPGPYLFGAGEDLTPVTMYLEEANGDELPDLIVRIKNEELIYLNRGDTFSPMSDAERRAAAGVSR